MVGLLKLVVDRGTGRAAGIDGHDADRRQTGSLDLFATAHTPMIKELSTHIRGVRYNV
jgi:hypothetical protein